MIDLMTAPLDFDENVYLAANPDVAQAVEDGSLMSGWQHVLEYGHREDRAGLPPDVKTRVQNYWQQMKGSEVLQQMPPPELRERVHGTPDYPGFYLVGARIASDLDAVLSERGRGLPIRPEVFDFGCGCGRVISHLKPRHAGWKMTGSDIDAQAIAWCRERLGHLARFEINSSWPPLPLEPNAFDLIYAISVFSHLPEDMQFAWLDELRRIAKPGALLLLSVHPVSLVPESTRIPSREFFYAVGEGTCGLPDFYQTTFHSRSYILDKWSDFFNIVDVIDKRINRHQDLVVCRKPR